eukprot:m.309035 g.309035  ORF g.309035 m.309035 type:complete len:318 (+) comp20198_c0_seq7:1344-2297(+)
MLPPRAVLATQRCCHMGCALIVSHLGVHLHCTPGAAISPPTMATPALRTHGNQSPSTTMLTSPFSQDTPTRLTAAQAVATEPHMTSPPSHLDHTTTPPPPMIPMQPRVACTAEEVARRYDISGDLGTGNFADVYEAFDRVACMRVAIKVLKQQPEQDTINEGDITALLCDHANVVQFLRAFWVDDVTHFVFEYADGGDLFNFIAVSDNLDSEAACKAYLLQACAGLGFVHSQAFVHMDVKMENMLLVNNTVKLCDFGLAGRDGQVRRGVADGTTAYMAPELVTAVLPSDVYTIRCAYVSAARQHVVDMYIPSISEYK